MYPNTLLYVTASARPRLTRAEQRQRTRAALLDAAERAFAELGFQGASVEAIAERAGFTRGAFYSNFASKEELFAELLQDRAYRRYRAMAEASARGEGPRTMRAVGDELAAMQAEPEGRLLFRLWLELLAAAGRDPAMRTLAAGFWTGTRALSAQSIERAFANAGMDPPAPPDHLASAMIAMDIGLALQHFVDPEGAPLDLYPELYHAIFAPLTPPAA